MIKTERIYIETSVVSHLQADDRPDREAETFRLWSELRLGKFEIVIGSLVLDEIDRCVAAKRDFLDKKLSEINYEYYTDDEHSSRLASEYICEGGLPSKSEVDARHIAIASLTNCDCVLSWNCKHIVTVRAMRAVKSVNLREGLKMLELVTPTSFLAEG